MNRGLPFHLAISKVIRGFTRIFIDQGEVNVINYLQGLGYKVKVVVVVGGPFKEQGLFCRLGRP